jgi:hypothetical protein
MAPMPSLIQSGIATEPLLANIYLHYVFDLWVDVRRKKCARGELIVLRYADDIVLSFQWGTDADRFRKQLGERLRKFGLELHPDKTRRIEFGRYAEQNRKRRGRHAGDLRLPWLHAYQREESEWFLCCEPHNAALGGRIDCIQHRVRQSQEQAIIDAYASGSR